MGKTISIAIVMFTLLLSNNVYGQIRCNSSIEIDSLFSSHFLALDTTMVCGEKKLVLANDIEFVYLVGIMSNISVELHSYTGHPLLSVEDVLAFKKWYIKNKPKITCDHIKRVMMYIKNGKAYSLLDPSLQDSIEEMEKYSNELEELKIKDE